MRLLNASTWQLESFLGTKKPPYAILSHTWETEGEILFEDLIDSSEQGLHSKSDFLKVKHTCKQALQDGYQYVWIDTCCIDKSSSAELSESINSMFRWYQQPAVCYAYLADVDSSRGTHGERSILHGSRWFTRGWTLQELIAPDEVELFDMHWQKLGSRSSRAVEISEITGIQEHVLGRGQQALEGVLHSASVAQRMHWASKRTTTREEDMAYCLLGLFDVNMPLLYGEGKKAFLRLQQAIIVDSDDQSILAFRSDIPPGLPDRMFRDNYTPVLAPDVSFFRDDIRRDWRASNKNNLLTFDANRLTLEVYLIRILPGVLFKSGPDWTSSKYAPTHVALLDCTCGDDYLSRPAIFVRQTSGNATVFRRCSSYAVLLKATAHSLTSLTGIGGRITYSVESLSTLSGPHSKTFITLEDQAPTARESLSNVRLALYYHSLMKYCSVEQAFPEQQRDTYQVTTMYPSVGIIAFRHKQARFFVTWGSALFSRDWCSVHTLAEMRSMPPFVDQSFANEDETSDYIFKYARENQQPATVLTELFKRSSPKYQLSYEAPSCPVDVRGGLAVSASYETVEFIGRVLRVVRLIATPITS
ncbi:hypothetical protein OPT61_g1664 [Boeremia exigua]|uniref:Uncharacterized protein n=1 Tax=Boeremia exigua TaxID=749465 RepID=A0ACC2IPE4_9PLEO|nr:hypothetical protein OPT61_g1664 [Boeremia exigua]